MKQRTYSMEALEAIRERQYMAEQDGVPVLIKPIPETDEPGVLDPRLRQSIAPMLVGPGSIVLRGLKKLTAARRRTPLQRTQRLRLRLDTARSVPIVDDVCVRAAEVVDGDVRIPVRIYTPKQPKETPQPVFYYIHGGGFVVGNMDVVDEMCKLLVQKTGFVAVQVEYRLAPEHPFPAGLDDCCAVLRWIAQNAAKFGGDPARICVSGDSAGGNLALVCALRDRDEAAGLVKLLALFYPTVDVAHMADNMKQNRAAYEVSKKDEKLLDRLMKMLLSMLDEMASGGYLVGGDAQDPYVSPYLADLHALPPTILLLGEYDFFRVENDRFARKMMDSDVEIKYVRYRGLTHGFADQVGVKPQAEDALIEVAAFMKSHFN